jgi:cell division GTPase FtsZ
VLRQGVQGISDIITVPGLINLDFADVRAIMRDAGSALMGIGRGAGDSRAIDATRQAIASPLLEININGAQGILFNIAGSANLSLFEVTEAAEEIRSVADPEANIIFGTSFDERLGDEIMITVIATGFDSGRKRDTARRESGQITPVAVHAGRFDTADFLQELENQRAQTIDSSAPGSRGVMYGSSGPVDRAPVAVPVTPAPTRQRPNLDPAPARRNYDDTDLEIPSFLRRPPQEEKG